MVAQARLQAFDLLKLFAIFLVIWGHTIQYFLASYHRDELVWRLIYSFHMPLFMMISGYFSVSSMRMPFKSFVLKKFSQLILPCITWSLIIWGGQFIFDSSNDFTLSSLVYKLFFSFWFLRSCFLCYLIAWLGHHSCLNIKYWGPLTLIVSQFMTVSSEYGFDFNIPSLYICFFIGIILKYYERIRDLVVRYRFLISSFFVLLLCFWGKQFFGITIGDALHNMTGGDFTALGLLSYKYIIGIVGSLAFIGVFLCRFSNNIGNGIIIQLSKWGQMTMGIYIIQTILLQGILANYIQFASVNSLLFSLLIAPGISVIFLFLCVYIVRLIMNFKTISFVLLGK